MTCENFRSRIAEMFDSEHIANDMWKHIAECDNCRNYYAECCATVNFITPKAKIPTPNLSTKKSRRSRWHFSRSMRSLSYAALTIMAALLAGIAVYHYDLSDTAHAATQAFSKASLAMSEAENFTATIMVRTRPQDNFNFIDIDAPFVEHTLAVTHSGNRCLWNISKGNHHVVCDGLAQYQWQDDAAKAYISPNNENIIGIFNILYKSTHGLRNGHGKAIGQPLHNRPFRFNADAHHKVGQKRNTKPNSQAEQLSCPIRQ